MSNNFILHQGFGFNPAEVFDINNLNNYFAAPHLANDNSERLTAVKLTEPTPQEQAYLHDLSVIFGDGQTFYNNTRTIIEAALDYNDSIEIYYHQNSYRYWNLLDGPEDAIYLPNPDVIVGTQTDLMYSYQGAIWKLASALANIGAYCDVKTDINNQVDVINDYLTWFDDQTKNHFSEFQVVEQKRG